MTVKIYRRLKTVMMNARTVRSDVSADDGDGLVHQKKGVIMAKKRVL